MSRGPFLIPASTGKVFDRLIKMQRDMYPAGFSPHEWIARRIEEGCFIVAIGDGMGDYHYSASEYRELRREVLDRDGRQCRYCGGEATAIDHVLPKTWGGLTVERNLVAACPQCNSRKGGRL